MVAFFFDPSCPWTWRTSRWLIDEADRRKVGVDWRSFPLPLTGGDETDLAVLPPRSAMSIAFLRVVEHLRSAHRNDQIGALYTAVGSAVHWHGAEASPDVVAEACRQVGLDRALDAAGDERWDEALRASLAAARSLVGDDVGSPVVVFDSGGGFFGPILTEPPAPEDAARIWDATEQLAGIPQVAELKRARDRRALSGDAAQEPPSRR